MYIYVSESLSTFIQQLTMELSHVALDIVRCDLCDTPVPSLYCDFCHTYLCKACAGEHLLDASKQHYVVPFKDRRCRSTVNFPLCKKHSSMQCELYCEQCEVSICDHCVSSDNHESHNIKDYSSIIMRKKDVQEDLMEFENNLYPKYIMMSKSILGMKTEQCENSKKITTALIEQGEIWHKEIDTVINNLKSKLEEMDSENLAVLTKREDEITFTISKIEQNIADLRNLLDSNDESLFFKYKSKNAKFRRIPPKLKICLPNFTPQNINIEDLIKQFGSLSALLTTTEDHENTTETSETGSFSVKPLLDRPQIITTIQTEYGGYIKGLRRVAVCNNGEEIWTSGDNSSIMSLYNLKGELLKTIQTRSGNMSWDITVTKCGDLVYTDYIGRTVDIVKNTQIQEVIKLQDWRPCSVGSTSSDDLLVLLKNDYLEQTKVVRYSGSTEIQSIQFNNNDTLYSSSDIKYITENRNLDICVADSTANAVIIVDYAGQFRSNYPAFFSTTESLFEPIGITTDSQGRIITTYWHRDTEYGIYILDQDGKFLHCIDLPYLHCPWGVCVDNKDNLFIAEYYTGKVKKIKYC